MSSRNKKKSAGIRDLSKQICKRVENSWILLAKDSLLENSNFCIITIPHPANKHPTKYCLDDIHSKVYEVVTFEEPHRSWFIGDSVKSDGRVLMCSPVNPVFLVLPRLREHCTKRAIPLEDLLSEKGFDKLPDFVNLDKVADLKGPSYLKAYMYNEEKTLQWLEKKVHDVAKMLKDKNIHVKSGAVSATFVASKVDGEALNEEFYLKYAHGVLAEYLECDLADALEKRFNFTPDLVETLTKKRKSEVLENASPNKKVKSESSLEDCKKYDFISSTQNLSDIKKQKPLTNKEKAKQRAASGTKTISSFFSKK